MKHKLDSFFQQALTQGVFPGAVLLYARGGEIKQRAWGQQSKDDPTPLEPSAWFDLASLTKPLVTAPMILQLAELEGWDLAEKLGTFLPQFTKSSTADITLMDLLTHRSGFSDWEALYEPNFDRDQAYARLMNLEPQSQPGSVVVYSCLNYLLLAQVFKGVTGIAIQDYFTQEVIEKYSLQGLSFSPKPADCIPTSYCNYRKRLLQGEVQDENAAVFGSEAGNSGLFGTAQGVYDLLPLILPLGKTSLLGDASLELLIHNQNPPPLLPRAVGWDMRSPTGYQSSGDHFPSEGIGHLGFTGTSCWIQPQTGLTVILLTHRVNLGIEETRPKIREFRPGLHNFLLADPS